MCQHETPSCMRRCWAAKRKKDEKEVCMDVFGTPSPKVARAGPRDARARRSTKRGGMANGARLPPRFRVQRQQQEVIPPTGPPLRGGTLKKSACPLTGRTWDELIKCELKTPALKTEGGNVTSTGWRSASLQSRTGGSACLRRRRRCRSRGPWWRDEAALPRRPGCGGRGG